MENKKNELDELLKSAMQFTRDEQPIPAAYIQKLLRKKVERKKTYSPNQWVNSIMSFMNTDIKVYHAGLAVCIVTIVLTVFLPAASNINKNESGKTVLETDTLLTDNFNTMKQDSFLVKNFSSRFY